LTLQQDILILLMIALFDVLSMRPTLLTPKSLRWFYSATMLLLTAFGSPISTTSEIVVQFVDWVPLMQLSFSVLSGMKIRQIIAWNLVLVLVGTASVLIHLDPGDHQQWTIRRLTISQVVLAVGTCIVATYGDEATRRSVEASQVSSQMTVVRSLLDTIYDAVLELDEALTLTEHSPRLAALLLLDGSRSLKGRGLESFMTASEDQSRFQHVMGQPLDCQDSSGNTRVLHFSMRDASYRNIHMEMFGIPFIGMDDSLHHLIGMREFSDAPHANVQQEEGSIFRDEEPSGLETEALTKNDVSSTSMAKSMRQKKSRSDTARLVGTPRETTRQGLFDDSQLSSGRSSHGSLTETRRLQRIQKSCFLTANLIKDVSLSATMRSWNAVMLPDSCCEFHALVREARTSLNRLKQWNCRQVQMPENEWQCPRCGIIDELFRDEDDENACSMCAGFEMTPVSQAEATPKRLGKPIKL